MTIRTWSWTPSIFGKCVLKKGTTLDLAESLRGDLGHRTKEGPGFCGAEFSGTRKRLEDCVRVWHLSLDVDGGVDVPEIWLETIKWEFIAYSSYSDTLPGKGRRFRVIIPLKESLTPQEFRELGMWALERWPFMDPMIKSASMSFYSPRTPDHGVPPWFRHSLGIPLDAKPIVTERLEEKAELVAARRAKAEAAKRWREQNGGLDVGPYLGAVLDSWVSKVRVAPKGERTTTLYAAGRVMGGYIAGERLSGGDRARFSQELEAAAMANGMNGNIKRHISNGMDEGETVPLMVPPPRDAFRRRQPQSTSMEPENSPPLGPSEPEEFEPSRFVKEQFTRAPVSPSATIPADYSVSRQGVYFLKRTELPSGEVDIKPIRVAARPIFIHRRYHATATKRDFVGVTWLDDLEGWREAKISRSDLYGNGLVKLADSGAPVTKNNVTRLIAYFEEYEHENARTLPRVQLVDRLGWHGREFLWGSKIVTEDGVKEAEDFFFDEAAGDPSLLESMHRGGTFEGWRDTVNTIADFPYAWLYIAAAVAAPLLTLTGTTSFIIDNAYQSSSGKSTSVFGGASVWGRPELGHMVGSWYSTRVGIEETCAMSADLPVFFDESKLADADPMMIRGAIYMVTGAGKKRGKAGGGLRKTKSWKTIFCTCGEQQLYKYGHDDGARARTVGAEAPPFGEQTVATGNLVDAFTSGIKAHYGHAGPLAVQHIAQHRSEWTERVDRYQLHFRNLVAGVNSKALRKARYFAALRCALDILQVLGVNYSPEHLDEIWRSGAGADDLLKSERAIQQLSVWVALHMDKFYPNPRTPAMGWAGRVDEGTHVDIPLSTLKMALGGMWEATLPKLWAAGGQLDTPASGLVRNVRFDGCRLRSYRFRWSTLFGGADDE